MVKTETRPGSGMYGHRPPTRVTATHTQALRSSPLDGHGDAPLSGPGEGPRRPHAVSGFLRAACQDGDEDETLDEEDLVPEPSAPPLPYAKQCCFGETSALTRLRKLSARTALATLWQSLIGSTPDFFQDALGGVGPTAARSTESEGRLKSLEEISKAGFFRFVRSSRASSVRDADGGNFEWLPHEDELAMGGNDGPTPPLQPVARAIESDAAKVVGAWRLGKQYEECVFGQQDEDFHRYRDDHHLQDSAARDLFRTPRDGGLFGPRFGDGAEDQRDLFVRRPSDVYVQLNQLKAQLEQLKGPQGGPVRVQLGPALREQHQQFPDLRKRIRQFERAWFDSPSVLALPPLVRVFRAKVALARYPFLRAGIGMGSVPLLVRILTRAVAGGSGALLGGAAAGTLPAVLFAISKSQDVLARAMNLADVTHLADVEKAIAKRCDMANMDTEQVPRSKAYSFLQLSRRPRTLQKKHTMEGGQRSVVVSPTGASGEDTEKPKEALEG